LSFSGAVLSFIFAPTVACIAVGLLDVGGAPKKRGFTGRGETPGALNAAKALCGPAPGMGAWDAGEGTVEARLRDLREGSVGCEGLEWEMVEGDEAR
jgi:hypothetical protein